VIKVITGQRRSGKSYLLQSIIERYDPTHVLYIDYELKKNDPYILDHVLYTYITDSMPDKQILAIDEIQKCRGWEHILLSLLKEYPLLEIWITGSNSSMLANDLTTHIRGRYLTIHVLPFSFEEYCQYFLVEKNSDSFVSYIDFG
jgi:predicted AAA+ superfamily ATPase